MPFTKGNFTVPAQTMPSAPGLGEGQRNDGDLLPEVADIIRDLPQGIVPIADLAPSLSPREKMEDPAHARVIAEMGSAVEPILVHRRTMRVIDGVHRIRAARMRGKTEIRARFFDGSDEDAFVLAVQLNVGHGLPLTLSERRTSAQRIILSHPHWSDRAIARRAGLNAKTVARLRREAGEGGSVAESRVGMDGRARPLSSVEGRRSAAAILAENPEISLREVSRKSGLSVGTVRDVRKRVDQGQDPIPERFRRNGGERAPVSVAVREPDRRPRVTESTAVGETAAAVRKLARDPSLRATEAGRTLLRMLTITEVGRAQWEEIMRTIPEHWLPLVRAIVLQRSQELRELAYMVPGEDSDPD